MNQGARDGKDEGKKESECGYMRVGRADHGDKKEFTLGGIIFLLSIFSIHPDPVNHPALHVGLQEVFCEVGGWVNLSEKCSQFFHPL